MQGAEERADVVGKSLHKYHSASRNKPRILRGLQKEIFPHTMESYLTSIVKTGIFCSLLLVSFHVQEVNATGDNDIGQNCNATVSCIPNLSCLNSRCACTNQQYYLNDTRGQVCKSKLTHGQICNSSVSNQCVTHLICTNTSSSTTVCDCHPYEYYDPTNSQNPCRPKIAHGAPCNSTPSSGTNVCKESNTGCIKSEGSSQTRCLCTSNYYRYTSACHSLDDLKVWNISVTAKSTTTVNVKWEANNHGATMVTYTINLLPDQGQITSNSFAGAITGLSPGAEYTITVTSNMPPETYYPDKSVSESIDVWTEIPHNGLCDATKPAGMNICEDTYTACIPSSVPQTTRCLCTSNYYRNPNNTCRSLSELRVIGISATQRTTTSMTLSWNANNYGSPVSYSIQAHPSDGSVSGTVNSNGGKWSGLIPGKKYNFTITTTVPASGTYPARSTSTTSPPFWTKPAAPGPVSNCFTLSIQPSVFSITFGASQGFAEGGYTFRVWDHGEMNTTETNVEFRSLMPDTTYTYIIIAYNGVGEASDPTTTKFTTPPDPCGPVSELIVNDTTAYTAQINWETPAFPNGHIYGYILTVKEDGTCVYEFRADCSDCPTTTPVPTSTTCNSLHRHSYSYTEFNNTNTILFANATGLNPYHNYTATVQGINELGPGIPRSLEFRTDAAAAKEVTSITPTSHRDNNNSWVDIQVTWTPGNFTGPTSYEVVVEEEISLNSGYFKRISDDIVTGYFNTTSVTANVLAFWNYRVSVIAKTVNGNSSRVGPVPFQTHTNTPGIVQNIALKEDELDATYITLQFDCPTEKDRNGTMTAYTIRKTVWNSDTGMSKRNNWYQVAPSSNSSCKNIYSSFDFGGVTVGNNYSFAVSARNQDFNGSFSHDVNITVEPRAPRPLQTLQTYGVQRLLWRNEFGRSSGAAIDVYLCASCILDARQGPITEAGLIVCVKGENSLCAAGSTTAKYNDFISWRQAKESSFSIPYRATPDGWIKNLDAEVSSYPETVGANSNCDQLPDKSYCNGPLPTGKQVQISIITCNVVGCVLWRNDEFFQVAEAKTDSDGHGMEIGLGVGISVAALIVVGVVVGVCWHRQKTKPFGSSNYDDLDQNKKDSHAYAGVPGGAGAKAKSCMPGSEAFQMEGVGDNYYLEPDGCNTDKQEGANTEENVYEVPVFLQSTTAAADKSGTEPVNDEYDDEMIYEDIRIDDTDDEGKKDSY